MSGEGYEDSGFVVIGFNGDGDIQCEECRGSRGVVGDGYEPVAVAVVWWD